MPPGAGPLFPETTVALQTRIKHFIIQGSDNCTFDRTNWLRGVSSGREMFDEPVLACYRFNSIDYLAIVLLPIVMFRQGTQ